MSIRWWSHLVGLAMVVLVVGCNGGTEPSVPTNVQLDVSTVAFTAFEQTQQLTPQVFDQHGNVMGDVAVTWSSDNAAVVSVTNGLVTAKGVGTATIMASIGAASANALITVVQAPTVLRVVSGDVQSGPAGSTLPEPLVIEAVDANLNPISDATIQFRGDGNVTFHSPTVVTGVDGRASSLMTVLRAGTFQVRAVVANLAPEVSVTAELSGIAGSATQVLIVRGNNPTVALGTSLAPVVIVADAYGNGVGGVPFRVDVVAGGGSVGAAGASAAATYSGTTGADGQMSFEWNVGAAGDQRVRVSTPDRALAGSPTMVSAMVTGGFISPYDIDVRFITPVTANQALAFAAAERRWERHIVGDLAAVGVASLPTSCANGARIDETIDDLLILVEVKRIDGRGSILGSAGPCLIRNSNKLPVVGVISLDVDDLEDMESNGTLQDVIVHEMGHVLGIGTLWETKNLLTDPARTGGSDPHFVGTAAINAFNAAGGVTYAGLKVPVENLGGPGTADGHWRESVLGNEMMTGYVQVGANPLSAISIRSLQDLGYVVDAGGADSYTLGQALRAPGAPPPVKLEGDIREGPIERIP